MIWCECFTLQFVLTLSDNTIGHQLVLVGVNVFEIPVSKHACQVMWDMMLWTFCCVQSSLSQVFRFRFSSLQNLCHLFPNEFCCFVCALFLQNKSQCYVCSSLAVLLEECLFVGIVIRQ